MASVLRLIFSDKQSTVMTTLYLSLLVVCFAATFGASQASDSEVVIPVPSTLSKSIVAAAQKTLDDAVAQAKLAITKDVATARNAISSAQALANDCVKGRTEIVDKVAADADAGCDMCGQTLRLALAVQPRSLRRDAAVNAFETCRVDAGTHGNSTAEDITRCLHDMAEDFLVYLRAANALLPLTERTLHDTLACLANQVQRARSALDAELQELSSCLGNDSGASSGGIVKRQARLRCCSFRFWPRPVICVLWCWL